MRVLNESRSVAVTQIGGRIIEAEIQVRGFRSRIDGSGFGYERHTPEAVTVRSDDSDAVRTPVRGEGLSFAALAAPLAVYLLVRTTLKRRSNA